MTCITCWGEGYIVTCIDDICVGSGHCIHGDGEMICPDCHGEGDTFDDDDIGGYGDWYDDLHYPDEFDFPTEQEEWQIETEEYQYSHGDCLGCGGEWGEGWTTCTCGSDDEG